MQRYQIKQSTRMLLLALSLGYAGMSQAHEASAVTGEQADFLGYALVSCDPPSSYLKASLPPGGG